VKRLLREITRLAAIEPGWDIVFIARPVSATTDFAILKNNVLNLLSQARILEIKPPID
jgi:ribonuclease P protein component